MCVVGFIRQVLVERGLKRDVSILVQAWEVGVAWKIVQIH